MPGVEKGMGAVALGIINGKTLLRMDTGHGQLSPSDCGAPARVVGLQEEGGVLLAVSQAEELLFQLVRFLQPALHVIERIEPRQRQEELRSLTDLLTQLPRPAVGSLDFWSRKAFE